MGQLQGLIEERILPTELVKVSDKGGFEVRGLSPYDVTAVFLRHRGEMSGAFDRLIAKMRDGQVVGDGDAMGVVVGALETAPHILAEIVCIAAGNDPLADDWEAELAVARRLPVSVQADAVQKIAGLTFNSEMPPGKFLAVVISALQNATATMQQNGLNLLSIGSGTSGAK